MNQNIMCKKLTAKFCTPGDNIWTANIFLYITILKWLLPDCELFLYADDSTLLVRGKKIAESNLTINIYLVINWLAKTKRN